jgi:predicted phosphoribosyltransferase
MRWARASGAEKVVLAVPVAPPQAIERLGREADEIVVLATPQPFFAVGEWYRSFDQTTDDEVIAALERSAERAE